MGPHRGGRWQAYGEGVKRTRALADTSASGCRYERPRKQASYQQVASKLQASCKQVKNSQAKNAGSCVLCGVLITLSLGAMERKGENW